MGRSREKSPGLVLSGSLLVSMALTAVACGGEISSGDGELDAGAQVDAAGHDAQLVDGGVGFEDAGVVITAFPNKENTGVPAGTTLSPCDSNITQPGTYDRCHFTGVVTLFTDNVTIRRSKIDGIVRSDMAGFTSVVFEDVEIDSQDNLVFNAIGLDGYTCRRCQVHNARVCFGGQGVLIEDSYCYDLHGAGDPATSGSHNEPILVYGTRPNVIRNNNLVANWNATSTGGGMSAVIAVYATQPGGVYGPLGPVTIEGNRLANTGGAYYCLYTSQTNAVPTGFRVLNNTFVEADPNFGRGCRSPTYPDWVSNPINAWSGNVTETGGVVPEPPSQ